MLRQPSVSVSAPPTTGPIAKAKPFIDAHAPSARAPLAFREREREQRQGRGDLERRAEAGDGARRDQRGGVRRERARGRTRDKERDPGDEDAAAAQPVAEASGGEDRRSVREVVRVDEPAQRKTVGVQRDLELREREVDDGGVELREEHARAGREQRRIPYISGS
jgi:hypothetical protein